MKRLQGLFFSFDGRIGRGQFWLGVLCILLAAIALSLLAIALGFSESISREGYQVINGERTEISAVRVSANPKASVLIALVMAAPWLAIAMKRRRDRGFNGYDVLAFTGLNLLAQALGLTGMENAWTFTLGVILFVWGIILLILLGFLKGEPGDNQYGPNPLAASTQVATGAAG